MTETTSTIYEKATGRISHTVSWGGGLAPIVEDGFDLATGSFAGNEYWWNGSEFAERPIYVFDREVVVGEQVALVGLPTGALVSIQTPEGDVFEGSEVEGSLELEFDHSGSYKVSSLNIPFPWLPSEGVIEVTE